VLLALVLRIEVGPPAITLARGHNKKRSYVFNGEMLSRRRSSSSLWKHAGVSVWPVTIHLPALAPSAMAFTEFHRALYALRPPSLGALRRQCLAQVLETTVARHDDSFRIYVREGTSARQDWKDQERLEVLFWTEASSVRCSRDWTAPSLSKFA
jgi:hypothetical protein